MLNDSTPIFAEPEGGARGSDHPGIARGGDYDDVIMMATPPTSVILGGPETPRLARHHVDEPPRSVSARGEIGVTGADGEALADSAVEMEHRFEQRARDSLGSQAPLASRRNSRRLCRSAASRQRQGEVISDDALRRAQNAAPAYHSHHRLRLLEAA